MHTGKEIRSRFYAGNPALRYLPEGDRYLFAFEPPRHTFAIIGAGMIGQEHLRVTALEGRATVRGIFDPNPGSVAVAQQVFEQYFPQQSLEVYDSFEAACADPGVDALILCTPNYTHIDVVRQAVRSGKHILLEKPMATTLTDAHEILRIAQSYAAVFQIGLQYRYKSIYAEAIHEALERKVLGNVRLISMAEHRIPFLDKVQQWNKFAKFSGGTLVEKCCHYFDLLNLFAQSRPVSVYAAGSMAVNFVDFEYRGEHSDILDNACVTVRYANGVHAAFNLCMFAPMFYEEIVICGDEGRLRAFENEDFLPGPRFKTGLEIACGERRSSRTAAPCYPPYIEETGHNGATYFEHIDFVENIEGRPTKAATAEEGFWSIVVGVAAEESARTRQVVQIAELLRRHGIDPEEAA